MTAAATAAVASQCAGEIQVQAGLTAANNSFLPAAQVQVYR